MNDAGLTTGGWVVMIVSIVSVLCLLTFCLTKVFSLPPVEDDED